MPVRVFVVVDISEDGVSARWCRLGGDARDNQVSQGRVQVGDERLTAHGFSSISVCPLSCVECHSEPPRSSHTQQIPRQRDAEVCSAHAPGRSDAREATRGFPHFYYHAHTRRAQHSSALDCWAPSRRQQRAHASPLCMRASNQARDLAFMWTHGRG